MTAVSVVCPACAADQCACSFEARALADAELLRGCASLLADAVTQHGSVLFGELRERTMTLYGALFARFYGEPLAPSALQPDGLVRLALTAEEARFVVEALADAAEDWDRWKTPYRDAIRSALAKLQAARGR